MKRANKFEPLKNVEGGGGGLPDPAPAPEAGAPPAPAPSGESPPATPPVAPPASPQIPPAVLSRIGELTRKNREAQERQAALEAELAAARQAPAGQAPTPMPPPATPAYDDAEVQRRATELADLQQWNNKAVEIWNNGSGKFQDFGVNVNQMVQLLGGAVPRSMTEAAIAVGEPETVLYELSKNLGEAARIAVLPPAQQGAEIAKFAQKIKSARAPQVSNAPAPITPQVGGAGTVQSNELSDDLPIGEWMARRNRQAAGR